MCKNLFHECVSTAAQQKKKNTIELMKLLSI